MARGLVLFVLGAAVLIAPACSSSGRADDAAAVSERFHAALQEGDGATACERLAPETKSRLEQQEKAPCEEAILELELPKGGTAAKSSVYVTTASVSLAQGTKDFLDEFDDGWRVSAAGCRPTAPNQPYDCELEG